MLGNVRGWFLGIVGASVGVDCWCGFSWACGGVCPAAVREWGSLSSCVMVAGTGGSGRTGFLAEGDDVGCLLWGVLRGLWWRLCVRGFLALWREVCVGKW